MFGKTKVRHRSTPGAGIFRPYHRPGARAAAVLLSFCVAFTMMPAPVFAVTQDPAAETGLCEHHPAHTEECGYREAEPGHPCEHEHTADCYTDELICGYIEDEDVTASDSDAGHVHTQECYALDCPHERGEHNEECGYAEGEKGVSCEYVCAECGEPEEGGGNGNTTGGNLTGGDNLPVPEETKPELVQPDAIEDRIVTSFDELDKAVRNQTVKVGTPLEELALPDTLAATAQTGDQDPKPVVIDGVTWEPDALYEGEPGEFTFTASAAGYTPAQGVEWPVITVTVEEAAVVPDEIETLCAAIDALPTVEELYENAPGDADPEFDGWVTETKAKLAEVSALWEKFLTLSEDGAAMERITDVRAEKLAALNNLAERLGEMATLDVPTAPTVDSEYNVIYANGAELKIVAGETEGYTNILYDKNNDHTIGNTEYLKIGTAEPTAAGYDLSSYFIYGGSQDADVDGATKITMTGGKVHYIYGGGIAAKNTSANVTGDAKLKITGGQVTNIFGGGNATENASANVTGDAKLEITGGEIGGWVYGGGMARGGYSSAAVQGSSTVAISGTAVIKKHVLGGGYANNYNSVSNVKSDVTGAATVTISGNAEVQGNVYQSGNLSDGDSNLTAVSDANGNSATVGAGSSIIIGDSVKIGGAAKGIVINGGTDPVATGVESFVIDPDLTGADASVNVVLPAGYDVSTTPTIATGAVEADLAKINLVGSGAEGKEAYFENNEIKVRKKSYTVTVGTAANGTVSASPTSAAAGTEVTLTVNPDSGYQLEALTVYKTSNTSTTVTVSNNKFTMPSYNVTVSATFQKTADQTAVDNAKAIIEGGSYSVAHGKQRG